MRQVVHGTTKRTPWAQWGPARLASYLAAIVATVVLATIATRLLVPPAPSPWHQLVWIKNALLPLALFAIYAGLVRLLEHRPAHEIGIRQAFPEFLVGALLGTSLMGGLLLTLWWLGFGYVTAGTGLYGLGGGLLVPLVTAMGEELLFRAVLFRMIEEMAGTTVAILVSAAIFGLSHAGNPGATPFVVAELSVELGVVVALAYVLTRNIWLAIGIHMTWNFTQGYLFGVSVSGVRDPQSLLQMTLSGPDLITGGAFGPEGSILMLGLSLVASGVLFILAKRSGHWIPPGLRLRSAQPSLFSDDAAGVDRASSVFGTADR